MRIGLIHQLLFLWLICDLLCMSHMLISVFRYLRPFFGSSRFTGERGLDLQKEIG